MKRLFNSYIMKPMRVIRKRILFIVLGITMLGTIAYFYINNIFIPVRFKQYVINKASTSLNRKVDISDIRYELIKGFTIKDVTIYQKEGERGTFLNIDEISFNVMLFNFLMERHIVIPTLKITRPSVNLKRTEELSWDFTDILKTDPNKPKAKIPNFYFKKIELDDGTLYITDLKDKVERLYQFNEIDIEANLTLEALIEFGFGAKTTKKDARLSGQGSYSLREKSLKTDVSVKNIALTDYTSFFPLPKNIVFNQSDISSAQLNIDLSKQQFTTKGGVSFNALDIKSDNISYQGPVAIDNGIFKYSDDIFKFTGLVKSPTASLMLGDGKSYTGNLNANITKIIIDDDEQQLAGILESEKTEIKFNENQIITGDFIVNNLNFQKNNNRYELRANALINNGLVKADGINHIKGQITFDEMNFALNDQSWKLFSIVKIEDGDISLNDTTSFTGDFLLSKTEIKSSADILNFKTPMTATDMQFIINPSLRGSGNFDSTHFEVTVSDNQLRLNSDIHFSDADIRIHKAIAFKGDPKLDFNLTKPIKEKSIAYKGTLVLEDSNVSGLPTVNQIDNLDGKIEFDQDSAKTRNLTFVIDDTSLAVRGRLSNYTDPNLDLSMESDELNLDALFPYLEKYLNKYQLALKGKTSLKADYKGKLSTTEDADLSFTSVLKNATILSDKLAGEISSVNGQIDYKKDLINWHNLQGTYKNRAWKLTGNLNNFSRPTIISAVDSGNISFNTEINLLRGAFDIISLKGSAVKSSFDLSGRVDLVEGGQPIIDVSGDLDIDLDDYKHLPKKAQEKIEPFDPKGGLNIKGLYRGQMNNWRDWVLAFKADSPRITVKNHDLYNVQIDYDQRDRYMNNISLLSTIYDGELNLNATADLSSDSIPVSAKGKITDLQLATYRKHNRVKNQYLSGNLKAAVEFNGPILKKREIIGKGSAVITNGYLGRLVKEFKQAEFTEAESVFHIGNGKISTDQTTIYSDTIALKASGWIDFDQRINIDFVPHFGEAGMIKAGEFKIDSSAFLANAVSVTYTGTLKNPIKTVNKSAPKIIGNTTEIIGETIGGIFRDILQ